MRFPFRRRAAARFEDVLAGCLASIEEGSADVESCLAAHPGDAEQLGAALRTALALRDRLAAQPDAAFVQRTRARVLAAAGGIRTVAPAPQPLSQARAIWRPLAMAGSAAVLVLTAMFISMMAATSANALPGDWNYPVKLTKERVELALGVADHLDLAEKRAEEVVALADRGRTADIEAAARAYQAELAVATAPLTHESPPPAKVEKIKESVARQEVVLRAAEEKVQQGAGAAASPRPATPSGADTATPPNAEPAPSVQVALSAVAGARAQAVQTARRADEIIAAATTATPGAAALARTPAPSATPASATGTAGPASATPSEPPATPTATPTAETTPVITPARPRATVTAPAPTPAPTLTPRATFPSAPAAAAPARVTTPAPATPPPPAVTFPAPAAATASPTPAEDAIRPITGTMTTPTPAPTAAATRGVAPTAGLLIPGPITPVTASVTGVHSFVYCGPSAPLSTVLAALAGKYAWVEWLPPGGQVVVHVNAGDRAPFTMLPGSQVSIYLVEPVRVLPNAVCGFAP